MPFVKHALVADSPYDDTVLTPVEAAFVQKLFNTGFHGYAQVRLGRLAPHVLNALVRHCTSPTDTPLKADSTVGDKVARILKAKKSLQMELRCATPAPLTNVSDPSNAKLAQEPPKLTTAPPSPAVKIARPIVRPATRPVFQKAHGIQLIAFNTLKLRLDRDELQDEWDAAVLEFSAYDVLLLSEVRAGDKMFKNRVHRLVEMLNDCTEDQWTWQSSEPSNNEVHLVLAKRPIDIVDVQTLHKIDDTSMDYAPLVATLTDPRFVGELRTFNVTSVHMPPKSGSARRAARDAQIRKLVAAYPAQAALRLSTPFANQAAKETRKKAPYVAHIIGGDFNADAKELRELGADEHGWEIVLGSVRTSSGGKAYDNWLISRDTKDHLTHGAEVLDLANFANFSRGQQGISDHAPILLRLREVPRLEKAREHQK